MGRDYIPEEGAACRGLGVRWSPAPSSGLEHGAWCSMEIVGDRAADGAWGHIVTRSNMQSGSFSCLLTAIANTLTASPSAFLRSLMIPLT